MKPNPIGDKSLYLNPSFTTLNTAVLAAIDGAIDQTLMLPYAYTATVRDDYDARNYNFDNAGADLPAGTRAAVGLFLSAENEKKNFLWQLTGKLSMSSIAAASIRGGFFFGRRATSSTVVSNGGSPQNSLAQFMYLPETSVAVDGTNREYSIRSDHFSLELAGGFVYCFGFFMENYGVAVAGLKGSASLAFRKYRSELAAHQPSR